MNMPENEKEYKEYGERQTGPRPEKAWKRNKLLWIGVAVIFGVVMFLLGYFGRPSQSTPASGEAVAEAESDQRIRYWTCSMHPHIRMSEPGKCPICYMDLVPVYESTRGGVSEGPNLVLSERARQLAEIETAPVESRPLTKTVRMVGKIDYDETRLAHVSAWIGGRIDKLHVNYVGVRVRKGDPMADMYSPELRTAQEEYLIADRRWKEAQQGGDESETASALAVKDAIQKKLELWGILPEQIAKIGGNGGAEDHMTIFAPAGGTVIAREALEGKYVQPGERLFTIVDLAEVWANLDAYEIDLEWLQAGQPVEFETDVFPGESFKGKIAFIQPVLEESTRTVKVRVDVPNPDERLKPGMYVRARLETPVDAGGRSKERSAKGKQALSIPATAPLLTGKRAVVYVEQQVDGEPVYSGRQVELGPRVGDYYLVRSGLQEGERVVTRGNFKIDAALQIQAKPSMMKPEGGGSPTGHQHAGSSAAAPAHQGDTVEPAPNVSVAVKRRLPAVADMKPVLEAYLQLTAALAKDDSAGAAAALDSLRQKAAAVDPHSLSGESHERFAAVAEKLKAAIPATPPTNIEEQRTILAVLSKPVGAYLDAFHHGLDGPLFEVFCSMAFGGKGGTWYQSSREIANPYFGASMLRCGEIKSEFGAEKK